MPPLIDVSLRFDTLSVPTPEVVVGSRRVVLFDGGVFGGDTVDLPTIAVDTPTIRVPQETIPVPDIEIGAQRIDLADSFLFDSIPIPDVELELEKRSINLPLSDRNVIVVTGVDLRVSFDPLSPAEYVAIGSVVVPDLEVTERQFAVGGQVIQLPDIRQELPDITLPAVQIPELVLPEVPVIDVQVRQTAVPDPTTFRIVTDLTTLERRLSPLQAIPDAFLSNPSSYVFDTALSTFRARLGQGVLDRLRSIGNAVLETALSSDTKQKVRAAAGDE